MNTYKIPNTPNLERRLNETLETVGGYINSQYTLHSDDESTIKVWSIQLPAPYSEGADPTGDKNLAAQTEYQQKFKEELFNLDLQTFKDEHFLIYTESPTESLEVHFNDSTLNLIYHFTGQW